MLDRIIHTGIWLGLGCCAVILGRCAVALVAG